ncbi:hypothetical protein BAE44_0022785 [Dichanthelium oligosanthes]|uniref:U-box domain-containing protein n=1 Tax=Dichanthelium oligosanthes TaxID=888268 RepID=A0A1E5UTJ5_9POAL|nr:hypothetical protein BAE44_0022785 [Dichanthelium oligosanthes]
MANQVATAVGQGGHAGRELQNDLAMLHGLLPAAEVKLTNDVAHLFALALRPCWRPPAVAVEVGLKAGVLALIQLVEREIVPERKRLEGILEEVGINDPANCSKEIETLEGEIGGRVVERLTPSMIALVGLLCYTNCVLFSAAMPQPVDSMADLDDDGGVKPQSRALDFCVPSLKLMCNPIMASSSQTYNCESVTRWFGSGKSTCPKIGMCRRV